jgi:hypothetical protein
VAKGEGRNAYTVWVRKPFGRPHRRLKDNVILDLREINSEDSKWTELVLDLVH